MAYTKQQVRNIRSSMVMGIVGGLFVFCMFHLAAAGGMDARPDHGPLAVVDFVLACAYCWGYAYALFSLAPALNGRSKPHWLVILGSVSLALGGLTASFMTSLFGWYHGFLDGLLTIGIVFGFGLVVMLLVALGRYLRPFFVSVGRGIWWNLQEVGLTRHLQSTKTPFRKLKSFVNADEMPDDGSTSSY